MSQGKDLGPSKYKNFSPGKHYASLVTYLYNIYLVSYLATRCNKTIWLEKYEKSTMSSHT